MPSAVPSTVPPTPLPAAKHRRCAATNKPFVFPSCLLGRGEGDLGRGAGGTTQLGGR